MSQTMLAVNSSLLIRAIVKVAFINSQFKR